MSKQKQEPLLKKSLPVKQKNLPAKSVKNGKAIQQSEKAANSQATASFNKLNTVDRKKPLKTGPGSLKLKQAVSTTRQSLLTKQLLESVRQPVTQKKAQIGRLFSGFMRKGADHWPARKPAPEQKKVKPVKPISAFSTARRGNTPEETRPAPASQPDLATHKTEPALPLRPTKLKHKNEPLLINEYFSFYDYKNRFYFALAITCSLLVFSPFVQESFNFSLPASFYPSFLWLISSLIFFYGGWPFFIGLSWEIVHRRPGKMTLFVLAVSLLYAYNTSVALGMNNYLLFGELILVVIIVLFSCWLEQKALLAALGNTEPMANLMPDKAHRELDQIYKGIYEDVSMSRIHKNDILFVKPGERIPVDSIIISGESYVDESKFSGESKWVFKKKGDKVLGGSLNGEGALRISVEKIKEDSYLFKIIKLLNQGQQAKTDLQLFTERALSGLTAMIVTVGLLVFISWLVRGRDFHFALERLVTCLIVACPPALGIIIAFINNYLINQFGHKGFFICNYTAFEKANQVSMVLFEKTGILTRGKYEVIYAHGVNKRYNEKTILKWAAALEQQSNHPIAQALLLKAEELNLKLPRVDDFEPLEGKGVQGIVNGLLLKVVGVTYLREHGIREPEGLKVKSNLTRIFLVKNGNVLGVIGLEDNIREESYPAIRQLQKNGVKCWLLTGDSCEIAGNVAADLGMSGFSAELLPREKEAKIKELQVGGEFVCLVGDSTKDLSALTKANMSLAVGVKNNVTAEKVDICCINPSPREVANFLLFTRNFSGKVQAIIGWFFLYSLITLFLATGVLSGLGILLSPVVAAILMSVSSLLVILSLSFSRGLKTSSMPG